MRSQTSMTTSGSLTVGLSLHAAQTVAIADHIAMRMDSRFGNVALVLKGTELAERGDESRRQLGHGGSHIGAGKCAESVYSSPPPLPLEQGSRHVFNRKGKGRILWARRSI